MNYGDDLVAGADALRKGEGQRARELFLRYVQTRGANAAALLGVAQASLLLDDHAGKLVAINQLLNIEPNNIRALILKGDDFDRIGDTRSAASFYTMALRSVPPGQSIPTETARELQRAQAMCSRYAAEYQTYILKTLESKGFDPAKSSPRFAQSVDLILGKKKIYLQQPRYYYFPALPQIQFYDRADFPWFDSIERATSSIRAELLQVLNDPTAFAPYVQGDPKRPRKEEAGMLNNPAWSAFYLWKNGEVVEKNAARCPKTMEALRDVPFAKVPNRSPSMLFSLLKPGAHIPPHNGLINTRLICHLPIVVPPKCRFRVGNEERYWAEGKGWLFDDTIEHEAWNDSAETRVILLFDVWRPELTLEERSLVISLFEAIDAHSGRKPEWEI